MAGKYHPAGGMNGHYTGPGRRSVGIGQDSPKMERTEKAAEKKEDKAVAMLQSAQKSEKSMGAGSSKSLGKASVPSKAKSVSSGKPPIMKKKTGVGAMMPPGIGNMTGMGGPPMARPPMMGGPGMGAPPPPPMGGGGPMGPLPPVAGPGGGGMAPPMGPPKGPPRGAGLIAPAGRRPPKLGRKVPTMLKRGK